MGPVGTLCRKREITSVAPSASVAEAAQKMATALVGCVLVMEGGQLKGIFSERDLLNRVIAKGLDPKQTKISQVMSQPVMTIDAAEAIEAGYEKMQTTRCRHIPVVEQGKVVGMITMRDILERMMELREEENRQLRDYIRR